MSVAMPRRRMNLRSCAKKSGFTKAQ
jgi:hypothetical protein